MEEKDFRVGTRISHEKYGEGIVSQNNNLTVKVIFVHGGEIEFSKASVTFEVLAQSELPDDGQPRLNVREFERMLTLVLNKFNNTMPQSAWSLFPHNVETGQKRRRCSLSAADRQPPGKRYRKLLCFRQERLNHDEHPGLKP